MTDRSTKALLAAIALGIWLQFGFAAFNRSLMASAAADMSFFEQWLLRGAPVTVNR